MPKTEEDILQLPRAVRERPCAGPLDAQPHLADFALQSRYHTRRASATLVALLRLHLGVLLPKKAKTSELGESFRAPRDSQSQPPSTRRPRPSSPIEATQIADPKHFMSSIF
ncbi:hypothetical protein CK203_108972 [Vitis vinifera]|uniref:Uncharacterized protein n=1 Tax=Vitis vinifera TaxID=29760 RepID=A0A438BQ28_VITVI|nr:hypothetical protein CK203_108972 [Vitis vinifera]